MLSTLRFDSGSSIYSSIQGETTLVFKCFAIGDCAKGGHGAYTNSVDLNGTLEFAYRENLFALYLFILFAFGLKRFLGRLIFLGYETGVIQASEFRTYHTPLNTQVWHCCFRQETY